LRPLGLDYIWGGYKLGKIIGTQERIAELWMLSTNLSGQTTVIGGQHNGKTLGEYLATKYNINQVLQFDHKSKDKSLTMSNGYIDNQKTQSTSHKDLGVLIKFIDAKENLSVQVHPNDEYARLHENSVGKTEMWYIIDCVKGAKIYCGLNQKVDRDSFEASIKSGTVMQFLQAHTVKKGDCFFIPAGTVHAIGSGVTVCEVQQNSNITYRLYDYGRLGADGNPRPLHIQKGLEVSILDKWQDDNFKNEIDSTTEKFDNSKSIESLRGIAQVLVDCKYFSVYKIATQQMVELPTLNMPIAITVVGGSGIMSWDKVENGGHGFLQYGDSYYCHNMQKPIKFIGDLDVIITVPKN